MSIRIFFVLFFLWGSHLYGQVVEICDNAVDDDGDGLVDLNDEDCDCPIVEPISRIPNPSFESINCCPNSRSQLYCADGWIQASQATTDLVHKCGWPGWPDFAPPTPFPDGDGIVGFRDGRAADNAGNIDYTWKEYAGACLTAPLLAGINYRFEFSIGFVNSTVSPVLDVTFFGTTSCEYLPFGLGDETFGCPTNSPDWQRLTGVRVGWNRGWIKSQVEITPKEDIYAIAIGPSCQNTSATRSTYYYLDNLILDETDNFMWAISSEGNPCRGEYLLTVNDRTGFDYQWYKDGIAIIGEKAATTAVTGEGTYKVRISNSEGCFFGGSFNYTIPVIEEVDTMELCEGDTYLFGSQLVSDPGDYVETFISVDGCDSIVYLHTQRLITSYDTLLIQKFPDEKYEFEGQEYPEVGVYDVETVDDQGCNYFIHLQIENYQVYWPNIFSPNEDGNNDYFTISGGPELKMVRELSIYNRWGDQVFFVQNSSESQDIVWNGKKGNAIIGAGVYVFRALLLMETGQEKVIAGAITLVH
jgi:gliding motility-associated-like protein